MTEKRLHEAGDRLRVRRTLGDIRDVTSDDMTREVSYEASADLEGLLQQARLRTRMFGAAFAPPMLERYAVHEQLGKGGMGEVYKARDPELERFVAIKLLQTGLDERARERLSREAQAMARIEHNHVVRVYDTGTWRGRLFVVMEYMDGTTLREWQQTEKRTWREVLEMYVQAGRGLAKLHAGGLVHRDFKPDNVMLDRDGRVVVGDLGLVHVPDGREQAGPTEGEDGEPGVDDMGTLLLSRTLTRTGTRMGTPRYMSPEQSRGEKTDARSDQFSFCVALYEALYGAMPFAGENERDLADAAARSAFEPRPRGHGVPGWLDVIVRRGLMADADARFADMDVLLREVARRERRRRTVMWGAVASLPLLVMVYVLAARPAVVPMPAPEDPCVAVERRLANSPQSDNVLFLIHQAEALETRGELQHAEEQAKQAMALAQSLPVRAQAGYRLAHILGTMGEDRARAALDVLVAAEKWALASKCSDLAGEIATYKAKLAAEDLRDTRLGDDALLTAEVSLILAGLAPVDNLDLSDERTNNRYYAGFLEARGLKAMREGHFNKAVEAHEKALAIRLKLAKGQPDLDVSKSYNNLGNALSRSDDVDTEHAIEKYEAALNIRLQLLDKSHPLVSEVHYNLGHEYGKLDGGYNRALEHLERARDIDIQTHGEYGVGVLKVLVALSQLEVTALQAGHGDLARLQGYCSKIRNIHGKSLRHPGQRREADRAMEHVVLGGCHELSDEFMDALREYTAAADILEPLLQKKKASENVEDYAAALHSMLDVLPAFPESAPVCARVRAGLSLIADATHTSGEVDELRDRVEHGCPVTTENPSR